MSTPRSFEPVSEVGLVPRPESELLERVHELQTPPRRREVDLEAAEARPGRPRALLRDGRDQVLDPLHRVGVVRVGLVPLEHRELGLVLVRDAFVAEVLAELVDLLQPADDEALEVELRCDAEIEVGVQRFECVTKGSANAPP